MCKYGHRGLLRLFSLDWQLLKTTSSEGRNLPSQIFIQHFFKIVFIQHFFKIVLYWCLDLIFHNIGTPLRHNKYIFGIPIPFCHNLYLSATFKQCFTEFAGTEISFHAVYMWAPDQIPSCSLIGQWFWWSDLGTVLFLTCINDLPECLTSSRLWLTVYWW